MKRFACLLTFICLSAVVGCGEQSEGVSLGIEVVTGLVPGVDFFYADMDLFRVEDGSPVLESTAHKELRVTHELDYARGRRVGTFDGVASGQVVVRVRLLRADRTLLVARRLRVSISSNASVRVPLTSDCVGVSCPLAAGAGASAALSECLGGTCVPDTCDPSVPGTCPEATPLCASNEECPAPASDCVSALCVAGVCINAEREGACSASEWCNAAEGGGCEPLPVSTLDAGVDMPVVDAGVDMPMDMFVPVVDAGPACGSSCELADTPCQIGYWLCDADGGMTCEPLQARVPGTACGDGQVCDPNGVCSACVDGQVCFGVATYFNDCHEYRTSCAHGGVCMETPTLAPAGSSCWHGYDTAPSFCNDTGLCVPCIENSACESPDDSCAVGLRKCTGAGGLPGRCELNDYRVTGERCDDDLTRSCSYGGCSVTLVASTVVTGGNNSYALLENGTAIVWGQDRTDSTGLRRTSTVPEVIRLEHIATSAARTCATASDGTIDCWQGVVEGSPGGITTYGPYYERLPATLSPIDELDASAHTFCARSSGTIWCWGEASGHCVGGACTNAPQQVPGITDAISLHMGEANCVVHATGAVSCWDGDGSSFQSFGSTPTLLAGVSNAVDVTTGSESICVLVQLTPTTREARCWGDSAHDVLGFVPPSGGVVMTPTRVPLTFTDLKMIRSVNHGHCVVRTSGELWCWGDFRAPVASAPSRVSLGQPVTELSEGGDCHACGAFEDGELFCMAACSTLSNNYGQLGTTSRVIAPTGYLYRNEWMVLP